MIKNNELLLFYLIETKNCQWQYKTICHFELLKNFRSASKEVNHETETTDRNALFLSTGMETFDFSSLL